MSPKSYRCWCSSYACHGEVWQRRTIAKHRLADLARHDELRSAGLDVPRALVDSLKWGRRCFDEQFEVKGATATHKRIPHRRRISNSDSDDGMDDDDSVGGSSSSSTSNVSFNEDRHGAQRYATASAPVSSRHSTSGHGRSSHHVASTSAGSSSHRHSRVHSTSSSAAGQAYDHPHHHPQQQQQQPLYGPYPSQQQHPSVGGPYSTPYPVLEHAHPNGRTPFPPPPSAHTPQFFPHAAALPPVPTSAYYQQQQQHRPSLSMAPPSLPGSLLPLPLSSFRPSPPSFPLSHHALQPAPHQTEPQQQQAGQTPTPACSPPASAALHALAAGAGDGDGDMPKVETSAQAVADTTPAAAITTARATSAERGGPAASPPLTSSSTTASPPPAVHLPPVSDLLKLPAILNPSPPSDSAASLPSLSPSAPPSTTPLAPPPPTATAPPVAAFRPTEEVVAGLSHHELLANPLYRSLVDCVWRVSHGQSV